MHASRRPLGLALVITLVTSLLAVTAPAVSAAPAGSAVYDSVPGTLPGNVSSVGFEATSTSEFGDSVTLAAGGRIPASVDVVMSSWGCESGSWTGGCTTTPGATFSHPITLRLYAVGGSGQPGTLLLTKTQSFDIPYRPSADATNCPGAPTKWYSTADSTCYNGLATKVTFDLTGLAPVTLPTNVIWTVAYDSTHYGASPIGESAACYSEPGGCGYDSLNVGSQSFSGEPSTGTDVAEADAVLDSSWGGAYCDGGTGGTGSLRLDQGCWTGFRPLAVIRTLHALGPCVVSVSGSSPTVYTLQADCVTDHTVVVPQHAGGTVFDGAGHSITGVDPAGDHFRGAVVQAAAGSQPITVRDLTVTVSGLADQCDGGADRLRGILFDGVPGTITGNTVTGIKQGASGCQEGNAIDVRNAPFDTTGTDLLVTVTGNTVSDYQKTGIVASGSVAATVTGNTVTGAGHIDYIAQNGIQIGYGATATVRRNTVSGNWYTPTEWLACGLLIYQADGVRASGNTLFDNEKNNCNFGKGGGQFNPTL